jgi:hypothetical protein
MNSLLKYRRSCSSSGSHGRNNSFSHRSLSPPHKKVRSKAIGNISEQDNELVLNLQKN